MKELEIVIQFCGQQHMIMWLVLEPAMKMEGWLGSLQRGSMWTSCVQAKKSYPVVIMNISITQSVFYSFPQASVVEGIKSVPSVCLCMFVCHSAPSRRTHLKWTNLWDSIDGISHRCNFWVKNIFFRIFISSFKRNCPSCHVPCMSMH